MSEFVLQRDRVIRTTTGHSIEFKKGVPVYVPPGAVRAAMDAGAVPIADDFVGGEDEDARPVMSAEAVDPVARKAKILEVLDTVVKRNDRDDFSAAGKPHVKAISELAGFKVDKKELELAWAEYMNQDE